MLLLLVAQNILYKLFNHRGMMHSIPAIVITSLIALNLMYINGLDIDKAFSSMLFLGIGYISHLVVDFASTNNKLSMNGVNWTCLKLYTTGQNRKYRNTITYVILMLMIIITLLNSNLMKEVKIITNKRVQKNIYRTKY